MKPVQNPHPPIFFGGESDAALRRVVSHGQGWYGFDLSPEALVTRLQRLREMADEAGRDYTDLLIYLGPNKQPVTGETVAAYEAAGVDQLIVPVMAGNMDRLQKRIDTMASVLGLAA